MNVFLTLHECIQLAGAISSTTHHPSIKEFGIYAIATVILHSHWLFASVLFQAFVFLLMWFQCFNGFSGIAQVDEINLMIFSVIFTSIPPIVMGVLDKNMPDTILMRFPHLYKRSQMSKV